MRWRDCSTLLGGLAVVLSGSLTGCAYRLPAPILPTVYKIRVVAHSPDRYMLRLRVGDTHEYDVPADGRLNIAIPAYRAGCSVYLFDKLRIITGANPFTEKRVSVAEGRKIIRQLSLKEIAGFPLDAEQYHLVTVPVRQ